MVEKIILLCLVFFIPGLLVPQFLIDWFSIPSDFSVFLNKPWTVLTYAFVHTKFLHILSNLLVLFYFGNLFLDFFNTKKFLIYYFAGSIIGGIFFLLFYFFNDKPEALTLGGASAAITAIFIGIATKIPHYELKFRFLGNIKIWILAAIWVGLSVIGIVGIDAGAALAHIIGAIVGYLLTKLYGDKEFFSGWFKTTTKKSSLKKVYTNDKVKTRPSFKNQKENQEQINAILDKISKKGYDSLTKEEKEFLFNQKES